MKQQPRQLQRSKSLTEQAVEEIRARIVGGDFELGAPLSENTLAAELGVSKTPVREALLQLRSEGLVSIQPQRGSFVFNMSSAEVLELGALRETLELAALRLAADRDARSLADERREWRPTSWRRSAAPRLAPRAPTTPPRTPPPEP